MMNLIIDQRGYFAMRKLSEIVQGRHPLTMPPDATVRDACCRMRDQRAGAVMVVDAHGKLKGIFTGRDAVCRVLAENRSPERTVLSKVMTPAPCCLSPDRSAIEALRLMRMGGFRHVPVAEAGKIVGIVSRADFVGVEVDRLDEEEALWEKL
jgi:CBS domain-containing protein